MNRQDKEQVVQFLKESFQDSQASFLVGCKGMTVAQVGKLRRELREKGGSFKVAKLTLVRKATQNMPDIKQLDSYLKDQVALVFAEGEAPAVAKVLKEFEKNNKELSIIAGCMDNVVIGRDSVLILASLPSREVLLAKLCGTMKAPIAGFTNVLNMLLLRLLFVLKKIEEQKATGQ